MMKYLLILISIILVSCKTQDFIQKLPAGNLESHNTEKNDIAPTDQPDFTKSDSIAGRPFIKEFQNNEEITVVKSSSEISNENMNFNSMPPKWRNYLTGSVESISFLSKNEGIISFSHPLHPDFADEVNINITKQSGGTDLYGFQLNPEEGYEFLNLEPLKDINTEYWESHPFIADTLIDGEIVKLLIWASDAESPFSEKIYKDGRREDIGNIDLYYSFYKNGEWSDKKALLGINSSRNEITPFVYCTCQNPSYLFYSLNNSNRKDYDIYYNTISIDYENENIRVEGERKDLKKLNHIGKMDSLKIEDFDKDYINTIYDERYPYIAMPYKNLNNDSLYLYYSSDMFSDSLIVEDSVQLVGKGGFDLYKRALDSKNFKCQPQVVRVDYEVVVLDAENPDRIIDRAYIDLDENNAELITQNGNKFTYEIALNKKFKASGGSHYVFQGLDCKSEESGIISSYAAPKFIYDSQDWITETETEEKIVINPKNPDKLEPSKEYTIPQTIDGYKTNVYFVESITYLPINDTLYTQQKIINRRYKSIASARYDLNTYYNIDDYYDQRAVSNKSLNGELNTYNIKQSKTIKDTVWLTPVYRKPYDINLKMYVLNACDLKPVRNPSVQIQRNGIATDSITNFSGKYVNIKLQCGNNYKFYGGSLDKRNQKSEAFPKRSRVNYLLPNSGGISNGFDIQSKLTESGGISIDEITGNIELIDTIFVLKDESSLYTVNLKDAVYDTEILDPKIKIKNVSKNKEIIIEDDRFSFYPNPSDKYEIYGGSSAEGNYCIEGLDHIVLSYKKPKFDRNFKTYFNDQEGYKKDIALLEQLNGIDARSKYSSRGNTKFFTPGCDRQTFRDTIYLVPEVYLKPPCTIEFTEFEGYNRNVPYFQTGFWEVNTGDQFDAQLKRLEEGFEITDNKIVRKRTDYNIANQDAGLFPKFKDNYDYSIANGRWIELHPNNKYWGWRYDLYRGESQDRLDQRAKRIVEYEAFSKQVTDNLDLMAEKISNSVLPLFQEIDEKTPDKYGTKLLIEVIALSDARDVERGWYIGDETVKYKSVKYDSYFDKLINKNINIDRPVVNKDKQLVVSKSDLKKNNRVLSDLRAWFGYKEISKRILDNPYLKELSENNKILLPDVSDYSARDIDEAKIIFAVSGQKTDEYSKSKLNEYKRKRRSSYFTYDTTRRVEVVIRLVNYQNGKVIISDCCNENLEFTSSYSDSNARKED